MDGDTDCKIEGEMDCNGEGIDGNTDGDSDCDTDGSFDAEGLSLFWMTILGRNVGRNEG